MVRTLNRPLVWIPAAVVSLVLLIALGVYASGNSQGQDVGAAPPTEAQVEQGVSDPEHAHAGASEAHPMHPMGPGHAMMHGHDQDSAAHHAAHMGSDVDPADVPIMTCGEGCMHR